MTQSAGGHYGLQALKRSLFHFVLGKGVAACAAFAVLIVTIRQLTTAEFAVYTSMHAMVLMVGLLSSFGTNAVLMRFLPELRSAGNIRAMYQLLFYGMTARGLSYALIALLLFTFAGPICATLNLDQWLGVVRWYCLVGFLRINGTFVGGALESLLWQRETQYSAALSGLCKLAIVGIVVWLGGMDLRDLVAIEVVTELLLLALLLGAAFLKWRRDEERNLGDPNVLKTNRQRFNRFAFWNYMQNLTSVGYGSAPNRLFATYFLPREMVAIFGVIDRFVDYIRRYEPLRIFVGLVRPVFNSRFSQGRDFARIVAKANFLFRVNLLVLVAPMVILAVCGDELFNWLTAGKYMGIAPLFLAFYTTAIIASADSILDILVKVLEETKIYTISNLALSGSIGLAIPLMPYIGLWAIAIANGLGLLISFLIIFRYLKARGHSIRPDWALLARIIAYVAVSIALGRLARDMDAPVWLAAALAEISFLLAICIWPPLLRDERQLVLTSLKAAVRRLTRK